MILSRWATAALLVALVGFSVAPGPGASTSSVSFGLGIDVPDVLPEPRSLQEPAEPLARLEAFLQEDVSRLVQRCGVEEPSNRRVPIKYHIYSLSGGYDECISFMRGDHKVTFEDPMNDLDRWVMGHVRNGTVVEAFHVEWNKSVAALQRTMEALDEAPTPADPVEAELLAWLMKKTEWDHSVLDTVTDLYERYQESPHFWSLQNTFLNLNRINLDAWFTLLVLDAYPWQDPSCTPNVDPQAIEERIRGKLEAALASPVEPSREFRPGPINHLTPNQARTFAFYAERDWWPGLLWFEQGLDWEIAATAFPGEVYPTEEEAAFLVAEYRNHTRTISTDHVTSHMHALRFLPWDEPYWPARAATLDAVTWTFDGVGCK